MNLPANHEAERAVIGSVFLRPDLVHAIEVEADHFDLPAHAAIWGAIRVLADRGCRADPVTVEGELLAQDALALSGGLVYLGELQAQVPTAENAPHYARLVREAAQLRRLVAACQEVAGEACARHVDVPAFLSDAEKRVLDATRAGASGRPRPLKDVLREVLGVLDLRADTGGLTGITTGICDLDARTGGWHPSDLIVLAAATSQGKTAAAVGFAAAAAEHGHPAILFSLEQSAVQLAERLLVRSGDIDAAVYARGATKDREAVIEAASRLSRLPIEIDDEAALSIASIRARARRFAARHDGAMPLVIVDYLQLAGGEGETREREVASVSAGLKALAKDLRCPVIALSQFNREATRRDGRPRLSDLRESGAIEQDADVVAILWRSTEDREAVKLILAKQRNGPIGDVDLMWSKERLRFDAAARTGGDEW